MKLWIVDLEATCWERGKEPAGAWGEIIEIGATLFKPETCQTEDEFQCFVKPVLDPKLSDFCTALTHITQADVDDGLSLAEALTAIGATTTNTRSRIAAGSSSCPTRSLTGTSISNGSLPT